MRKKIFQIFLNSSHLTNIIPIPICKFWDSWTIPIPFCIEVGSANLFLFLFAGKITICWSLQLSNDHCLPYMMSLLHPLQGYTKHSIGDKTSLGSGLYLVHCENIKGLRGSRPKVSRFNFKITSHINDFGNNSVYCFLVEFFGS